jgi:hypothetical protein
MTPDLTELSRRLRRACWHHYETALIAEASSGERAAQRARRGVDRVEATWERRDGAAVAQRDVLVLPVKLGGVNRLWFLATPGSP